VFLIHAFILKERKAIFVVLQGNKKRKTKKNQNGKKKESNLSSLLLPSLLSTPFMFCIRLGSSFFVEIAKASKRRRPVRSRFF